MIAKRKMVLLLILSACLFFLKGAPDAIFAKMQDEAGTAISIESAAFKNGGMIPRIYTCDGEDISPPLKWIGESTITPGIHVSQPEPGKSRREKPMANRFKQTIPMGDPPQTVEDAVTRLISELPLKDRVAIAKMEKSALPVLHSTFATDIRERFGFVRGNEALMASCRGVSGNENFDMSQGPALIIDLMWARLRRTHSLRAMK